MKAAQFQIYTIADLFVQVIIPQLDVRVGRK